MEIEERKLEVQMEKKEKRGINDKIDHFESFFKIGFEKVSNIDRPSAHDSNSFEEKNLCDPNILVHGPIRKTVRKIITTVLFVFDFVSKKIKMRQIPGDVDVNLQIAA